MSDQTKIQIFLRRLPIYRALASMPPLSHWPDRSVPFDAANSEVLKFIMQHGVDVSEALKIQSCASTKEKGLNLICFNMETKLWVGTGNTSRLEKTTMFHEKSKKVTNSKTVTNE